MSLPGAPTPQGAKRGPLSYGGGPSNDAAAHRAREEKARLENDLRVKKNTLMESGRHLHDAEESVRQIDTEIAHLEQEMRHFASEVHSIQTTALREEGDSRGAGEGIREKDQERERKEGEIDSIQREVFHLKREIEEKERKIAEIKEELRGIVKKREDLRRKRDLEHSDAQTKGGHAREKDLVLTRLKREVEQKKVEREKKHVNEAHLKREIIRMEDDIREIESKLHHL